MQASASSIVRMFFTAEVNTVTKSDIMDFLMKAPWVIHYDYHRLLITCTGAAIIGLNMCLACHLHVTRPKLRDIVNAKQIAISPMRRKH